jgi:hypothetical protein
MPWVARPSKFRCGGITEPVVTIAIDGTVIALSASNADELPT